jgi:hypothetical protein
MSTETMHRPTPEFRDYLEGELSRVYRRNRTFRRYRGLAVVVASLAIGTSAGLASAQIRESAQRDSLLDAANADLALVAMRLELARAQVADVTAKVKVGALSSASAAAAQAELRRMEAMAMRATLNVAEIRATAQAPRDDLNAPLVNGRDFVTERLQLDLFTAQRGLTAAEETQAEVQRRVRVGAETELAVLDADLDLVRSRAALGVLAERRRLRKRFVEQGTPGDELARRMQQSQVRFDAMVAQEAVRVARARLAQVTKQRAVGMASELDQLRAELVVKERETELILLGRQLREMARAPE